MYQITYRLKVVHERTVTGQPYKTGVEKRNREGMGSPEKGTYDMMDLSYCAKIYVL